MSLMNKVACALTRRRLEVGGLIKLNPKSIEQYEQEVEINAALAKDIADVINEFCDEIEDQLDRCDSTDLSPKDIKNILLLCRHYKVQSLLDKNVD